MAVIEVEGLRKEYRSRRGRTLAVDGLDLVVPEGGVFAFLGPNGAGKTTTIRCLLGLVRPTAGKCRLLGAETPAEIEPVTETSALDAPERSIVSSLTWSLTASSLLAPLPVT